MDIRLELIYKELSEGISGIVGDEVKRCLEKSDFDVNGIAQTTAVSALSEIQEIVQNDEYDDFEIVEKIVCVFEKYKISVGTCHDFG